MRLQRWADLFLENWPAKIISLAIALLLTFLYQVDTLEERFFSVPLEVRINDDYVPANHYPEKVRILMRGSQETVYSVLEDDVKAWVDVREHTQEGMYREPVKIRREGTARNAENLEIRVEPAAVSIRQELRMTRSLEVEPVLRGSPARGFELVQYFMTPSSVTVEGPRSRVEGLDKVRTEEVSLTGKRKDFTTRVRLVSGDPFLSFPGGDVVEFRGVIDESRMVRRFDGIPLVAVDLDGSLALEGALPTVSVQFQGLQQRLEELRPGDFQFRLDCSSVDSPGVYTLGVEVNSPAGAAVLSYVPESVTLRVEDAEAGAEGSDGDNGEGGS